MRNLAGLTPMRGRARDAAPGPAATRSPYDRQAPGQTTTRFPYTNA
jgi:hypothetical protein